MAKPQIRPAKILAWFWEVAMNGHTACVEIVITASRDCGRPCRSTRQELSMIHLASPQPTASIEWRFVLFCLIFKSGNGQMYRQTISMKKVITTGRYCGTALWIKNIEAIFQLRRQSKRCFLTLPITFAGFDFVVNMDDS